jgi:hypothetical protein
MPGSTNGNSGGIVGLTLRAWVLFDGATGTIRKQFNVASVTRASAGSYTVNLSAAMSDTNVVCEVRGSISSGVANAVSSAAWSSSASTLSLFTFNGSAVDLANCYVAIYG